MATRHRSRKPRRDPLKSPSRAIFEDGQRLSDVARYAEAADTYFVAADRAMEEGYPSYAAIYNDLAMAALVQDWLRHKFPQRDSPPEIFRNDDNTPRGRPVYMASYGDDLLFVFHITRRHQVVFDECRNERSGQLLRRAACLPPSTRYWRVRSR